MSKKNKGNANERIIKLRTLAKQIRVGMLVKYIDGDNTTHHLKVTEEPEEIDNDIKIKIEGISNYISINKVKPV